MLKFSLTISLIILPILLIINIIVNIFSIVNNGYSNENMLISIIIFFIGLSLVFIIGLIIGFITYVIDKSDILKDNDKTITTGRLIINKEHIYQIKARRFIFLYAFSIYTTPWKHLGLLTYYFNNKEELIEFIKQNKFFIDYIREKDLNILEIK